MEFNSNGLCLFPFLLLYKKYTTFNLFNRISNYNNISYLVASTRHKPYMVALAKIQQISVVFYPSKSYPLV